METNTFLTELKRGFVPLLASEHGHDVDQFILYIHWLMAVLFVGWVAYFLYALWRFRAGANKRADYTGAGSTVSNGVEVAVVIVEAVLLIGFAVPLWAKAVDKFPEEKDATVMRVTAEQFQWVARYPGKDGKFGRQDAKLLAADNPLGYAKDDPAGKDDATAPPRDIRVPLIPIEKDGRKTFKPVIVHLTTKDVIHSFKVPALRMTQDCMPGLSIPVHFVPTLTGRYILICAQLCGNAHSSMNGYFTVEKPEDFDKWMEMLPKAGAAGVSFD